MKVVMGVSDRITVLDYGAEDRRGHAEGRPADPRVIEAYLGNGGGQDDARADPSSSSRTSTRSTGRSRRSRASRSTVDRGRDRDADRRERRRQVDDAALDQRAQPPPQGHDHVRGPRTSRTPRHTTSSRMGISQSPEGRKLFPRMTVIENLEMGAFQRNGQGELQGRHGARLRVLPAARRTPDAEGGDDVRRRAADVRDRPRADGAARSC